MRFNQYITESSLSRIMQHIQSPKPFGVISPFRADNSAKENEDAYNELKNDVRKLGYGYIPLQGGYKEESGFVKEKSLFIPGISRKEIIDLGKKYGQYSVLYKEGNDFSEIGTNKNAGIGKKLMSFKTTGKNISVDDVGDMFTEFFSKLVKGSHAGKKFLFVSEVQTGNMFVGSRIILEDVLTGNIIDEI